MNVTRVRPLQGRDRVSAEWRQGTYVCGTQVETWPAVYTRHQPRGGKTEPACRFFILGGGGNTGKKLSLGTLYRTIMLENVSVGVVDSARVKGVLGVSVRPRSQGRG